MEVKCPHCTSRFNLPDNLAKPGVKLRCSVCKAVFPFAPEPEAVLPGEDELPDMQERPSGGRRKFWVALALILLCLGGGAYWSFGAAAS